MEPLIIYIIGDNRSGSTLLDYLLSCHPLAYSLGEMHHLAGYYNKRGFGVRVDWKCSCGKSVQECDFWKAILEKTGFPPDFETHYTNQEPGWSVFSHRLHKKTIEYHINRKAALKNDMRIAGNCWKIYHAAAEQTGKPVIIDSSKNAYKAELLSRYRQGNIRFLLLERDIREISFSKLKRLQELDSSVKSYLNLRIGSIYKQLISSYAMIWKNRLLAEIIQKNGSGTVKRISYNDLTTNPQKTIDEVCTFLGIERFRIPAETNQSGVSQHVLGGSPSRYDVKAIQPDTKSKSFFQNKSIASFLGKYLQRLCG